MHRKVMTVSAIKQPRRFLALVLTLLTAGYCSPALSQKSKDTLRFPLPGAESTLDPYLSPGAFNDVWEPAVYDNLLGFDGAKGVFVPNLVQSWSEPTPTTYELELRTDVKWHDGQALDADDVIYTLNYITDPAVNLRYKSNWGWIKSIEKLGPHKLRITAKEPIPNGLMWFAYSTAIFPEHIHKSLADKQDFGATPMGTGPYRIVKLDKNTGIVTEKFKDFIPTPAKPAALIGRIVAEPVPDVGTLVATLLVGNADVARGIPIDQAAELRDSGKFDIAIDPQVIGYYFMGFPTSGWQNVKALADVRVRTAIAKAIDRRALYDVLFGPLASQIPPVEALCSKSQLGCDYTTTISGYDPAGAKKLLAEAGYTDGFDVAISAFPTSLRDATAISGMLRAVGIRASVKTHPIAQRVQLVAQGKVDIEYYGWGGGATFDVAPQIVRHFLSKEYDDPMLIKMAAETLPITDDGARRKAAAKLFDYATENAYAFPLASNRVIYTHTKEVKLTATSGRATLAYPFEFGWK